ncbi:MAG: tRNA pseudouridine(55) synthase TruB [Nitrosospira sp.]|nr:tRNA pseudouridine(55) synthase TruB [Nitrosospira sp.]
MNPHVSKPARIKRDISGVLLLDKPSRVSSNQALQIVKRIFGGRKAGHTGTLDPMATGLLPICFGQATKFSSALLGADKTYEATLRLGYYSTTGDAEGEISVAGGVAPRNLKLTLPQVETVLQDFAGVIMQVPPMYSALKHRGKPMYVYAREGVQIERQPREAVIHDLYVEALESDEMRIRVRCGSGTYIRTLAEDIGKALGCGGAYLTALRRTILGRFGLSQAYTLHALEAMPVPPRDSLLLPVDSLVRDLPAATLEASAAASVQQGRRVGYLADESFADGQTIRLYDQENRFLGLGEITAEGGISPKRLIGTEQMP